MITDKKLYVMRSTIDPTLKKTLWAKDINDVHEKIGEYYQIISVTSPTPALRAMLLLTPRGLNTKSGIP
jgi:hypothetical protein